MMVKCTSRSKHSQICVFKKNTVNDLRCKKNMVIFVTVIVIMKLCRNTYGTVYNVTHLQRARSIGKCFDKQAHTLTLLLSLYREKRTTMTALQSNDGSSLTYERTRLLQATSATLTRKHHSRQVFSAPRINFPINVHVINNELNTTKTPCLFRTEEEHF